VALNGNWNIPVGYFLIKALNANERANLLSYCLILLNDTGAKIHSITFDGAAVNLAMCRKLGANFEVDTLHFKPFIINPANSQKIFVIWDPSHMIKLTRNVLGDKKIIVDGNGGHILWEHICQLNNLQKKEGLHAANKLTQKHINFTDNRMNVKLAAQTLSESVSNSLLFVKNIGLPQFAACTTATATAKFCQNENDAFDILNNRNNYGKRNTFNVPISLESIEN
jgi:hypothetical protein